jgi:hypothetical protein
MTVFTSKITRAALVATAILAPAVLSSHALATVQFDIQVLGGTGGPYSNSFSQPGTGTINPQVSNYQGSLVDPFGEWSIINWDFNADRTPSGSGAEMGVRMGAVFTIQNNLPDGATANDNHLYFSIMISQALTGAMTATNVWGNGGMTLTIDESANGFPGTLRAIGTPIWNYRLNGGDVASLFAPPFQLGGSNGPSTISASNTALSSAQTNPLIGTVVTSMGIRLDFDLSPGERVTFNGAFGVIPAPGALALLGLAGLAGARSRRRN